MSLPIVPPSSTTSPLPPQPVVHIAKAPPPPSFLYQPRAAPMPDYSSLFDGEQNEDPVSESRDDVAPDDGSSVSGSMGLFVPNGGDSDVHSKPWSVGSSDVNGPPLPVQSSAVSQRSTPEAILSTASQPDSVRAKFTALQAYISDLESEKFENQRGLQQQLLIVAKLSEDQEDMADRFQSIKSENEQLRGDIEQYTSALQAKISEAADAHEQSEAAQRAVLETYDRCQAMAAENVALEETLLNQKSSMLRSQQSTSEWESLVATERSKTTRVEQKLSLQVAAHDKDKRRIMDRVTDLTTERSKLLSRLKTLAQTKGLNIDDAGEIITPPVATPVEIPPVATPVDIPVDMPQPPTTCDAETQCTPAVEPANLALLSTPPSEAIASDAMHENGDAPPSTSPPELLSLAPEYQVLLPKLHWGASSIQSAAIAETQVSVLGNIHALIDRLVASLTAVQSEVVSQRAQLAYERAENAKLAAQLADAPQSSPPATRNLGTTVSPQLQIALDSRSSVTAPLHTWPEGTPSVEGSVSTLSATPHSPELSEFAPVKRTPAKPIISTIASPSTVLAVKPARGWLFGMFGRSKAVR